MKNKLRYASAVLVVFLLFSAALSAERNAVPGGFSEYTLSNGLAVFICEDSSSAPVRIELSVRAGFSAQDKTNAGFFPLYTRLFATAGRTAYYSSETAHGKNWYPDAITASCNADSSRYILYVTQEQVQDALDQIASCASRPLFAEKDIDAAYTELKTEVLQTAFSSSGFINSSIDARVFSAAPWKQESGIYPALFTSVPRAQIRTVLAGIGAQRYQPQNSALFISGCIGKKTALVFAERSFGSWQPGAAVPQEIPAQPAASGGKKFVLYDQALSADMTQIIVQYTSLPMMQADIAAAAFSKSSSSFKTRVLSHEVLSIRGADYIDAAAAHKNGTSRLLFQSILEPSKLPPPDQAILFTSIVRSAADALSPREIIGAQQTIISSFYTRLSDSAAFMDLLAQFWADGARRPENAPFSCADALMKRPADAAQFNAASFRRSFNREEPYVFVLINTAQYKKYSDSFKKNGFEPVSVQNGSWYTQELYAQLREKNSSGTEPAPGELTDFSAENRAQFSFDTLANGIPVVMKKNDAAPSAVVTLFISGGKIASSENPGFSSVMADALASNIQQELNLRKKEGTVDGTPSVYSETRLTGSIITIECLSSDTSACIACIRNALIYGDIKPALADSIIGNRRTEKRISDASPLNQLYSAAVSRLYRKTDYPAVFDTAHEILEKTSYGEILSAYPQLLDPRRYTVIVTGNYDEADARENIAASLGLLQAVPGTDTPGQPRLCAPDFPQSKKLTVKLRHTFLTDVSADKAGPMPQTLVPTTKFSDPVQYWIPSPAPGTAEFALFNALVTELAARMGSIAASSPALSGYRVTVSPADCAVQAAVISVTEVERTSRADALYRKAVKELTGDLSGNSAASAAETIKNRWILSALSGTSTNSGTASLILSGLDLPADSRTFADRAEWYLAEYDAVHGSDAQTLVKIMEGFIPQQPPFAVYSADARK